MTTKDFQKILAENELRKAKYFRDVDQIIGDSECEVIPRVCVNILGTNYWLPEDMMQEPVMRLVAIMPLDKVLKYYDIEPTVENIDSFYADIMRLRIRYDYEFWCATCATIQDKETKANIKLNLNYGQRKLTREFERQRSEHKPIRVVVVKARQWGGSTNTECYMMWLQLYHYRNWHSAIISKINAQSANIRAMISKIIEYYPTDVDKFELKTFEGMLNTKIIPSRGCRITISSAEQPDNLRSFDFSMCHMSELAFWNETSNKSGDDLAQTVNSTIPDEEGTLIVKESTAKGVGGYFHDEWLDENENAKVFVAWFEIKLYQKPVKGYKKFMEKMSDYNWWQWRQGATFEGINWYNDYKKAKRYSDFQMKSEYPTTADEAFQTKAGKYFTEYMLEYLHSTVKDPVFVGDIRGKAVVGPESLINLELIENNTSDTERLKIWIMPNRDKFALDKIKYRFVVVVDIGGIHYKSDNSVITVLDRRGLLQAHGKVERAAIWYGHIDHDMLAWKAAQIAKWYDNALLVIESNTLDTKDKKIDAMADGDHSFTVIDEISDTYDNMYVRLSSPDKTKTRTTDKYGWHMNKKTKYQAYDFYRSAVRDNFYVEYCREAANEASYLELKKDGKIEAMKGRHDDMQDTTAVGVYVAMNPDEMPLPKVVRPELDKKRRLTRRYGGESTF